MSQAPSRHAYSLRNAAIGAMVHSRSAVAPHLELSSSGGSRVLPGITKLIDGNAEDGAGDEFRVNLVTLARPRRSRAGVGNDSTTR